MRHDSDFLKDVALYFNKSMNVAPVLKGGNALVLLYKEDRFSGDLDFDAVVTRNFKADFFDALDSMCSDFDFSYRVSKNTDTVTRVFLRDGSDDNEPLKIEVSYRTRPREVVNIDGIDTYDINVLCLHKCDAYKSRDRIRDIQDLSFILTEYSDVLSDSTLDRVEEVFFYKEPFEQFDYLFEMMPEKLSSGEWSQLANRLIDSLNVVSGVQVNDKVISNKDVTEIHNPQKSEDYESGFDLFVD